MADQPSLGSLPAELKGIIAQQCCNESMLRLRSAIVGDLDFMAEADKVFGQRFISKRTHYITKEGLQALADIAIHSTFGRYLKRVELVPFELNSAWQPQEVQHVPGRFLGASHVGRLYMVCTRVWRKWQIIVAELHGNESSTGHLSSASRPLKARNLDVELAILSHDDKEPRPFGGRGVIARLNSAARPVYSSCYRPFQEIRDHDFGGASPVWLNIPGRLDGEQEFSSATETDDESDGDDTNGRDEANESFSIRRMQFDKCMQYGHNTPREPANLVFSALADSGSIPSALGFDCTDSFSPPPVLTIDNPPFFAISSMLTNLTRLAFGFSDHTDEWRPRLRLMRDTFSYAVQLKRLDLNCSYLCHGENPGWPNTETFEAVVDIFDACPLEYVSISGLFSKPKALYRFLGTHKHRLRRMDFIELALVNFNDVNALLTWIAKNLDLEHLGFDTLTVFADDEWQQGCWHDSQLDGADAIKAKLLDMVARHAFAAGDDDTRLF